MKSKYSILLIILVSSLFCGCLKFNNSKPGLYINEFLASNNSLHVDTLSQKHSDWIELFNNYDFPIIMEGFSLTDDILDTTKWVFPKGTIIDSKSFLIVWADGMDTLLHTNFKLCADGETIALYSDEKVLLDNIKYSSQAVDISYGRIFDANSNWEYFDVPSYSYSNSSSLGAEKLMFAKPPEFSLEAGFYSEKIELSLTSENDEIRYTTDGSIPTRYSQKYTDPLRIESTTVVRAISVDDGFLCSRSITKSYFINVNKDLSVISLVADDEALWDDDFGIYKNSIRDRDRLANIEFFEERNQVFNQVVNISISGNIARFHGQKAILVEANSKYGNETIEHRIFPDKRVYSFKSLLLRAGGHPDKYETMFRDGMAQSIKEGYQNIDYQAYRPVVVYLNGKYWGIYNIREKLNANFIVDNHNLDKSQFDMLQTAWAIKKNGDERHFRATEKFIQNKQNRSAKDYDHVKTLIDVDNYIDYYISELYSANIDWPSWNIKFWREKSEDARWKWILNDLDYGFGAGAKVDKNMIAFASSEVKTRATNPPVATIFFRSLLEFPEYKNEFIQRFAASLNVIYSPERVLNIIEKFENQRVKEMPFQIERWKSSVYNSKWAKFRIPSSMNEWDKEIEVMRDFAKRRPDFVRTNINNTFSLDGMVNLKTISNGGQIAINTIKLGKGSFKGKYFRNIPLRLEAIPNPGQSFSYWLINGKKDFSSTLNLNLISNSRVEVVFVRNSQTELGSEIEANTTLKKSKSPYFAKGDVIVNEDAILNIEKGVEIFMEKHHSILIKGGLVCNGTEEEPVFIMPNPETKAEEWGALCIDNASSEVNLTNLNLFGGSWYEDKSKYKATITSLNSDVRLNNVVVESSHSPFYSEFGTVSISNSKLSSTKTCDLINIKYATNAIVENCDLSGNNSPDTDAIDYDGIDNGIIRNNTIHGFFGFNSDAIDIGEGSSRILIEENRIFNMSDKGISIGQASSAIITNNLIYGCIMGVGIKDSNSFAYIDRNTFYGNKYGIAVFEKNHLAGGGSAEVLNSIFYKSRKNSLSVDSLSHLLVSYSLIDDKEFQGDGNIYGKPEFVDEFNFNFKPKKTSLSVGSGKNGNQNMGAVINIPKYEIPDIVINEIVSFPINNNVPMDWIELYNNSDVDVDLNGWTITNENHNIYPFSQKTIIKKKGYLIVTNNIRKFLWNYPTKKIVKGILGKKVLNNANTLMLYNSHMNLVDYVNYGNMSLWPNNSDKTGSVLELKQADLNNNDELNWFVGESLMGSPLSPNK
jgi:hypothetical protein